MNRQNLIVDNSKEFDIDDRKIYEQLVCSHALDVYRLAYRLCGDRENADDLTQETMYHAWRSIESLKDLNSARPWLLSILHNRFKQGLRAQRRQIITKVDPEQLDQAADPMATDLFVKLSNQELLQKSLDALDERYKEPFLLVFMQDMTCSEVSQLLDLPLGTVLSRIHRARLSLRQSMQRLDPSSEPSQDPRMADPTGGSEYLQHKVSKDDE